MRAAAAAEVIAVLAVLAMGCESTEGAIGPRGGTVVSADGRFSLEIPAGALDEEVDITVEETDCADAGTLGPCYAVEPRGTAFAKPAHASYELGDMDLGGIDPNDLRLVVERDGAWNMLADRSVDTDGEVLEASALYLSSFAVIALEGAGVNVGGTCCDDGDDHDHDHDHD